MSDQISTSDLRPIAANVGLFPLKRPRAQQPSRLEEAVLALSRGSFWAKNPSGDMELAKAILAQTEGASEDVWPSSSEDQEPLLIAFVEVCRLCRDRLGLLPSPGQLAAALAMLRGRFTEVEKSEEQGLVLALASAVAARQGIRNHVVLGDDEAVKDFVRRFTPVFQGLGSTVGHRLMGITRKEAHAAYKTSVTVTTFPALASDLMNDGLARRAANSPVQEALDILRRDPRQGRGQMTQGMRLCLVGDADAIVPRNAIRRYVSQTSLLEPQGMRFAREALDLTAYLRASVDYREAEEGAGFELTTSGQDKLEQMARSRHGFWANEERRTRLVEAALAARGTLEVNRDYVISPLGLEVTSERCAILERVTDDLGDPLELLRAKHQLLSPRVTYEEELTGAEILGAYLRLGLVMPASFESGALVEASSDVKALPVPGAGKALHKVRYCWVPQDLKSFQDLKAYKSLRPLLSGRTLFLRLPERGNPVPPTGNVDGNEITASEDAFVIETQSHEDMPLPENVVRRALAGQFDTVVVDGLFYTVAIRRLIARLLKVLPKDKTILVLVRRDDPIIEAKLSERVLRLVDGLGRRVPHLVNRFLAFLVGWVGNREQYDWRRYRRAGIQRREMLRQRLIFRGK